MYSIIETDKKTAKVLNYWNFTDYNWARSAFIYLLKGYGKSLTNEYLLEGFETDGIRLQIVKPSYFQFPLFDY